MVKTWFVLSWVLCMCVYKKKFSSKVPLNPDLGQPWDHSVAFLPWSVISPGFTSWNAFNNSCVWTGIFQGKHSCFVMLVVQCILIFCLCWFWVNIQSMALGDTMLLESFQRCRAEVWVVCDHWRWWGIFCITPVQRINFSLVITKIPRVSPTELDTVLCEYNWYAR